MITGRGIVVDHDRVLTASDVPDKRGDAGSAAPRGRIDGFQKVETAATARYSYPPRALSYVHRSTVRPKTAGENLTAGSDTRHKQS